ncbi:MAG: hypothetical protein V9E93_16930 [Steroidobacteraceae bacterium]|mgnify:FL=1|nr:hypothetical protein [Pseudomonadota bacterium]MBP6106327.1 hypothetical protein [Steroidobacteraceae bacterium]MBP7013328.1 hypothetical protein [Steroidobacteraceae bacterium]
MRTPLNIYTMHPVPDLQQHQAMTMNSRLTCQALVWIGGVLGGLLSQSTIALAESAPATEAPAYYLGAGFRGGKGDATAGVIDSKIKLTNLGDLTLSTRPALLMGGYDTEWRLPVTVEGHKNERGVAWFGGGGLAYNMDDLGEVDAMLSGGLDMAVNRQLVVNLTINFIWQSEISDDDTEFMASLNYWF